MFRPSVQSLRMLKKTDMVVQVADPNPIEPCDSGACYCYSQGCTYFYNNPMDDIAW